MLITSRRAHWDASLAVHALPLATLPRAESIALLRTLIGDPPSPRPGRGAGHGEGAGDLAAIAAELGDLPLALHLAGSFLKHYRADLTPAGYLAELRSTPLLEHDSLQGLDLTISPTNHDLHVGRTFALSYERLDATKAIDQLARALLARAACFAPGAPIPRDLLLATVTLPDTAARRRATRAITRLVALGLLDMECDEALRLHRLVAAFTRAAIVDDAALPAVEHAMLETANRLNPRRFANQLPRDHNMRHQIHRNS